MARVTYWEHNCQTFAKEVLKIEKHENKKGDDAKSVNFYFFL